MSRFTNFFSKHIRERFTKEIELIDISRTSGDFIFTYKVLPFINLRVISKYTAQAETGEETFDIPCEFNNGKIKVTLSETHFDDLPDNFTITLFSFGQPMRIKRGKDIVDLRSQHIVNEKLYNIKIKRDVHISKRYMTLDFKSDVIPVKDVNIQTDSILITLNQKVNKDMNIFLSYPHKFIELPTTTVNEHTIKITNINTLTYGQSMFYIAYKENVYKLSGELDNEKELFTDYYNYKIHPDDYLKISVSEHIIKLKELYISEIIDGKVHVKINFDADTYIENPYLNIYNPKLDTEHRIKLDEDLSCEISIEDLIDDFTNKKMNFINNEIIYQIDISEAIITDEMLGRYRQDDEYLYTNFYRRKDNYLGFRVSRPRIRRRITDINEFTFKGFVKGRQSFHNVKNILIFEDRFSKETAIYEVSDIFKFKLNELDIVKLMSRDKTIIDVYVGMQSEDGNIVARTKLPYKNSSYRKDNFYDLKIVKEKTRDVYLLITTTPFNNLKVETFVIPNDINTKVKREKNIWLVGERIDTAQENGFEMFKYLQKTPVEAYYVIDKNSIDYEKIKHEENVLEFGSKKHYEISLKAGVLLCTHDFENILPYKPAKDFFNYSQTLKVFLQHGVLGRKPAEYHKKYYEDPFDIFIVSSDAEKYDVVVEEMGYDKEEVSVTGLARFDSLPINQKGKDILLMPTWRDWINTDEKFLSSEYYYRYKNLLENDRLHEVLEKYNVMLNFYPHYRAQSFFNEDMLDTNKHIKFITLGERTVQDLLIEHALLITDFSSVSFDFTMMRKPVIYYHFDEEQFFKRGILRPVNETFLGEIAETEELLVSYIEEAIKDDFKTKVEDISGIVKYVDHNNCKRIYEAVERKIKRMINYEDYD